jgi:ribosomal protein S18 acetylase RimI-like enzyme
VNPYLTSVAVRDSVSHRKDRTRLDESPIPGAYNAGTVSDASSTPAAVSIRIRPVTPDDRNALCALVRKVGVFESHEIAIADQLIDEAVAGSVDYAVTVAETSTSNATHVVGYVCFGHNPVTDAIYDLYWIAIDPDAQGRGWGRAILEDTERRIRALGGRGMTIETSSREPYAPARRLYERCGYRLAASIDDFYKPGDGLSLFVKFFRNGP